jgi:hypothetical protein
MRVVERMGECVREGGVKEKGERRTPTCLKQNSFSGVEKMTMHAAAA